MAIRHGEQNDITASYELKVLDDKEMTATLLAKCKDEVNQVVIDEAVLSALAVMKQ